MQQFNINELKSHPRNDEFFDDIQGENWKVFLESISSRGVIEPIVVTPNKVIVSGHQRVRACKELGIESLMCDVHTYDNEDQILQDLIETNIRQRGIGNPNPIKLGRCIKELERIYGIQRGGDRHQSENISFCKTQEDLANNLGLDVRTLQNYKKLTELVPELEDWVDTGILAPTTALAIVKELSQDEQELFVSSLDVTEKITKKKAQQYIDAIKNSESNNYSDLQKQLRDSKSDYSNLKSQFDDKVLELQDLRKQIKTMKSETPTEQYNKKLKDSTIFFCSKVADFIEKTGGYVWLVDHLNELPEYEKKSYISAVTAINDWSNTLLENIRL